MTEHTPHGDDRRVDPRQPDEGVVPRAPRDFTIFNKGTEEKTPDGPAAARRLAALLRDVLATQDRDGGYDCFADLVADLKTKAGKLRIPWTNDDINAALTMVGQSRELLTAAVPLPRKTPPLEARPAAPPAPHDMAAGMRNLQRLRQMMREAFKGKIRRWPRGRTPMTPEHIEEFRLREGLTTRTRPAHVAPLPLSTVDNGEDET